jgi:hypothetical protein
MSRIALLAVSLTALALAGCKGGTDSAASLDLCGINCTPSGGGGGGGGGTGGGTTDPNAPPPPTGVGNNDDTLTTGDATFVITDGGRSPSTGGLSQTTITGTGSSRQASVIVDPKADLGWGQPVAMSVFNHDTSMIGYTDLGSTYTEFRTINATTDIELQYWDYGDSYAGHYRVVIPGETNGGGGDAWFHGGPNKTQQAEMDTLRTGSATATYIGEFGAAGTVSNFIEDSSIGYDPNGPWRLRGDAVVQADFGAQTVHGNLDPTYWEKFEDGGLVQVIDNPLPGQVSAIPYGFHGMQWTFDASIASTGNTYAGTVSGGAGSVDGDNTVLGGFYGTNAQSTTGIFSSRVTRVDPQGGDTGINDDRRGFVDVQGFFHGDCNNAGGSCP